MVGAVCGSGSVQWSMDMLCPINLAGAQRAYQGGRSGRWSCVVDIMVGM